MKTGRIQTLGGIQYGGHAKVQASPLVGQDGPYSHPSEPGISNVGEALDVLLGGRQSYVEITTSPYLIIKPGEYICIHEVEGSTLDIILGNGMVPGDRVSIGGVGSWVLSSTSTMKVMGTEGEVISSLDDGCYITLLMTSRGWFTSHLLGNVHVLLRE